MVLDKSITLLRFVHAVKNVVNENPNFLEDTKNNYSYYIKIVDELGDETVKFTIGLKEGKWAIKPTYKPDVIVTITENAFFSTLKGSQTLEQAYFYGEADLWSNDGAPLNHIVGIKSLFDLISDTVRTKLEKS